MARRRQVDDPLGDFLDQVGDDIAMTLADLGDGLLIAGIAALTGMGVAKAAPAVGRVVKQVIAGPGTGRKALPAKTRTKTATRAPKALPRPRTAVQRTPESQGEVIDLTPGPDGIYR